MHFSIDIGMTFGILLFYPLHIRAIHWRVYGEMGKSTLDSLESKKNVGDIIYTTAHGCGRGPKEYHLYLTTILVTPKRYQSNFLCIACNDPKLLTRNFSFLCTMCSNWQLLIYYGWILLWLILVHKLLPFIF